MSDVEYRAIDAERLARMRERGADEQGNPWTLRVAEGWEPVRCCLRYALEGERIALIGYSPWTEASPWAETGPVFVHFERCEGYAGGFPEEFRHRKAMLNPFDHTGARAYDHITFVEPEDDHEAEIQRILNESGVAFLHVRSATAGCFTYEVRPVT